MVSERHFALKKRSGYASTSARVHARTRMHAQARAHAHAWADEHARMHTTSLPVQPEYGCCGDDKRNLARRFGSLHALEKRRCGHTACAPVQPSSPSLNHWITTSSCPGLTRRARRTGRRCRTSSRRCRRGSGGTSSCPGPRSSRPTPPRWRSPGRAGTWRRCSPWS